MMVCFQTLAQRGYRRLGLAISTEQDARVEFRWSGSYLTSQWRLSAPGDRIPPFGHGKFETEPFRRWFLEHRPDAIITGHNIIKDVLEEMGVRVPEDVALARPYDSGPGEDSIAFIDEHSEEIGSAAVDVVAGMMYRNEKGLPQNPSSVVIPGSWRDAVLPASGE